MNSTTHITCVKDIALRESLAEIENSIEACVAVDIVAGIVLIITTCLDTFTYRLL